MRQTNYIVKINLLEQVDLRYLSSLTSSRQQVPGVDNSVSVLIGLRCPEPRTHFRNTSASYSRWRRPRSQHLQPPIHELFARFKRLRDLHRESNMKTPYSLVHIRVKIWTRVWCLLFDSQCRSGLNMNWTQQTRQKVGGRCWLSDVQPIKMVKFADL